MLGFSNAKRHQAVCDLIDLAPEFPVRPSHIAVGMDDCIAIAEPLGLAVENGADGKPVELRHAATDSTAACEMPSAFGSDIEREGASANEA
jgi:hypothetical protein